MAIQWEWTRSTDLWDPADRALTEARSQRKLPMARSLQRSNAHFQKAVKRLPLGVSSNFRYWGEDRTIYIAGGKGVEIERVFNRDAMRHQRPMARCTSQ